HGLGFRTERWITRHSIGAPDHVARFRVIRRYIASNSEFTACIADHDELFGNSGVSRNSVRLAGIVRCHSQDWRARFGIERNQPAIQRSDIYLSAMQRDTSIHNVTADVVGTVANHMRIISP